MPFYNQMFPCQLFLDANLRAVDTSDGSEALQVRRCQRWRWLARGRSGRAVQRRAACWDGDKHWFDLDLIVERLQVEVP